MFHEGIGNDGQDGGSHSSSGCLFIKLVVHREVHAAKTMSYKGDEMYREVRYLFDNLQGIRDGSLRK